MTLLSQWFSLWMSFCTDWSVSLLNLWAASALWLLVVVLIGHGLRRRWPLRRWSVSLAGLLGLWGIAAGLLIVNSTHWQGVSPPLQWRVPSILFLTDRVPEPVPVFHSIYQPGEGVFDTVRNKAPESRQREITSNSLSAIAPTTSTSVTASEVQSVAGGNIPGNSPSTTGSVNRNWSWFWLLPLVFIVWAAGSVVGLVLLLTSYRQARQFWSHSIPVTDTTITGGLQQVCRRLGIRLCPEIRESSDCQTAVVVGLIRPGILLPSEWMSSLSPERMEQVLTHECAHLARHDLWTQALQRLTSVLWWPQPLLPLLQQQMDASREDLCDNCVLQQTEAPDYADTLLQLTQLKSPLQPQVAGLAFYSSAGQLLQRVQQILDPRNDRRTRISFRMLAVMSLGVLLGIGLLAPLRWAIRPVLAHQERSLTVRPMTAEAVTPESAKSEQPASTPDTPAADVPAKKSATEEPAQPVTATGRVIDEQGQGVAEVEVRVISDEADYFVFPLKPQKFQTDAEGRFTGQLPRPGKYLAYAFHGSSSSRSRQCNFFKFQLNEQGQQDRAIELKLQPGVVVRVVATSAKTGQPLPKAFVHMGWTDLDDDVPADADGVITLQPLTRQSWHIEVAAPGYARQGRDVDLQTDAETLEFALEAGGEITGVIRDAAGQPIPGVGVGAVHPDNWKLKYDSVETDDQGRYRLQYVPLQQPISVQIAKEGFARLDFRQVSVPNSLKATADFQMRRLPSLGTVRGVVTDQQGKPLPNAEVFNPSTNTSRRRETRTDTEGRFELTQLYAWTDGRARVVCKVPGYQSQVTTLERRGAEEIQSVTFKLLPGHTLRGRIVREDGTPVVRARIYSNGAEYGGGSGEWTGGRTMTDAAGRFQLDDLPEQCHLTISASGLSGVVNQEYPVDQADEITIVLEASHGIVGQVVDAVTGRPVTRFNVRHYFPLESAPDPEDDLKFGGISTTDIYPGTDYNAPAGRFDLGEESAGRAYALTVRAPGYRPLTLPRVAAVADAAKHPVTFSLTPLKPEETGTLRGVLLDDQGRPAANSQLRLLGRLPGHKGDEPPFSFLLISIGQTGDHPHCPYFFTAVTDEQGRFEFRDAPLWTDLELVYWGPTIAPGRAPDLQKRPAAEREQLEIRGAAAGRLIVQVDRQKWPTVSAVRIGSELPIVDEREDLREGMTQVEFTGVPPGAVTISLMHDESDPNDPNTRYSSPVISTTLTIKSGQTMEVKL